MIEKLIRYLLLVSFFPVLASAQTVESFYQRLDTVIADYPLYRQQINHRIDSLKTRLSLTDRQQEAYRLNIEIGKRYSWYIGDSALVYYNQAVVIAERLQNQDLLNQALYHEFRVLTEMGLLVEATDVYHQIKQDSMPLVFQASCDAARLLMTIQQWRLSGNFPVEERQELITSLQKHITPQDSINDIWAIFWAEEFDGKGKMVADAFEKRFRRLVEQNDVNAGQMLYYGSRYLNDIDRNEYIHRLCLSSEYKIKLGDNSLSPLIDLVHILMDENNYNRANNYLNFILRVQADFPDRTRSGEITTLVENLSNQMMLVSEREKQSTKTFLTWISVAFGLVLLLLIAQIFSLQKLRKQRKEITDYNRQLNENLAELSQIHEKMQQINRDLNEANFIKEEYIGSLFSSCATYIDKMDAFRQNINRKAKTGKMEDVLRYTAPDSPLMQSEVKELNESFDKTFLTIYPNFVTDFNTLLKSDCQIAAKEGKLNTELRICALIWLGIDSSSKIASLLHVAPKTIYNANARLRNMIKEEVPTAEQFTVLVRALGRTPYQSSM